VVDNRFYSNIPPLKADLYT